VVENTPSWVKTKKKTNRKKEREPLSGNKTNDRIHVGKKRGERTQYER